MVVMYSGAKLLTAHASPTVALSRNSFVLKLRSPPSHPQLANSIRCSLRESGHGNVTSSYADAASQKWQPSNFAFIQEEYRSKPILSSKDVIGIDEREPLIERAAEKSTKLGLSEEMVREISKRNNEPEWMLRFRLDAFRQMLAMAEPPGAKCPPIDFRTMPSDSSRLPQMQVSQELVDDASGESFATTHREVLAQAGVIFCPIAEAIRDHPELVRKYLGRVVAPSDNFYAALNSAVFRDGSFCYVPENVTCPMDISTHFLVAGRKTTCPFERTLIVCAEHASVTSLGCTSPVSDHPLGPHLHAPVIELFCAAGSEIKHVTVQNWLETGAMSPARDSHQLLCNYVTQRGLCEGARSRITWAIVEAGSGVTWQHPAVVLKGEGSVAECFSATLTTARQQADTGATMIHRGCHTRSRIVAKTISAGSSHSTFRGIVHVTISIPCNHVNPKPYDIFSIMLWT
jgi:Fe-S cluster assembly scaffold protein SufB